MDGYYYQVLDTIAANADSSLILFFVVAVIALVVAVIPLYGIMLRERKHQRQSEAERYKRYIEREREIIQMVKENSTALTECATNIANLKQWCMNVGNLPCRVQNS